MSLAHNTPNVMAGFSDPVHEAQMVFRQLLEALSHPGVIVDVETTCEQPGECREGSKAQWAPHGAPSSTVSAAGHRA